MKAILYLFIFLFFISNIQAQKFNPKEVLGYDIGDRFTTHHQLVKYFSAFQYAYSDQVQLMPYGKTNENRDLFLTIISSKENTSNFFKILQNHQKLDPNENTAIVWLSFNVHGNEASCSEAAMNIAHKLVEEHQSILKNTIVVIDPCLNPDGRDRYVNWYNQYAGKSPNLSLASIEHNEPWPSGRPNHYLFDLNRDWVWASQVETKQRLAIYNDIMPHVHADFHEQWINNPYYFAPAAEPFHEVISPWQRKFQTELGKRNASNFDKNGWLYFSSEEFDLLYPSYGDTYPTFCGAIGMTYEQAGHGRAGLSVITNNDDTLTLNDRIAHHTSTALETVIYSSEEASTLIKEYKLFVTSNDFKYKSYILSGNEQKILKLKSLLKIHNIKYSRGNKNISIKGFEYENLKKSKYTMTGNELIISTNQTKGKLIQVLFEPKTFLSDSLTYDITSWNIPYAYGLKTILSNKIINGTADFGNVYGISHRDKAIAYIAEWKGMYSAEYLSYLIGQKIKVRYTSKDITNNGVKYKKGSLIILKSDNQNIEDLFEIINNGITNFSVTSIENGMMDEGPDLGSESIVSIGLPNIGIVIGENTSSLNVGEIWNFFENELKYPYTMINEEKIDSYVLNKMDVLIVPEGKYEETDELVEWVEGGGKLISFGVPSDDFLTVEIDEVSITDSADSVNNNFRNSKRKELSEIINGAILKCNTDQSSPLLFGMTPPYYTLRTSTKLYKPIQGEQNPIVIESEKALMNGFIGSKIERKHHNTIVSTIIKMGDGSLIIFVDNPIFRGFWENGKLLLTNAIFFNF